MKCLARAYFWWPNLDDDINELTKKCELCCKVSKNPPKVALNPWPYPAASWERLHLDFLGPLANKYYLVVVDAYTKWLEVAETSSTDSKTVINVLRGLFARFGLPKTLVSDNASYFKSKEFENFAKLNNIKLMTSPLFTPYLNGAAENAVKTIKSILKKTLLVSAKDIPVALSRFLFDYRNNNHCTTGVAPSMLMFGRTLRTRFHNLSLEVKEQSNNLVNVNDKVKQMQRKQIRYYIGNINKSSTFYIGQYVLAKDYTNPVKPTWNKGKIIRKLGKCVYLVELVGTPVSIVKRHANQLKNYIQLYENTTNLPKNTDIIEVTQVKSPRPKREIKPFERLVYT